MKGEHPNYKLRVQKLQIKNDELRALKLYKRKHERRAHKLQISGNNIKNYELRALRVV